MTIELLWIAPKRAIFTQLLYHIVIIVNAVVVTSASACEPK
ncbi:MAG: hypothetical protein ACI8RO_002361 [Flavobacteriales bacterium]|jgi:hypothetical protein